MPAEPALPVINLDAPGPDHGTPMNPIPGGIRASGGVAVSAAPAAPAAPAAAPAAPAKPVAPAAPAAPAQDHQSPAAPPSEDQTGRVASAPASSRKGGGLPTAPAVAPAPEEGPGSLADAVSKALADLERSALPVPGKPAVPGAAPTAPEPAAPAESAASVDDGDPTAGIINEEITVDTSNWTPQAARAFERIKAQRSAIKAELEQARSQVAAYESQVNELKGALLGEGTIEELQARVKEFEHQRMFTDLESTSAYQEAIQKPLQFCVDTLDAIAERAGVSGDDLFALVTADPDPENPPAYDADGLPFMTKDQKIEALLAQAAPRDRAAVFATLHQVEVLMNKRAEMFANVAQAYQEAQALEQTKQQQAAAEAAKYRKQVTGAVVDRLAERIPFLAEMPGVDLTKLKDEVAAVDPKTLHPVDAQYQAAATKLFPLIVNDLFRAQAEVESLLGKLAEYETAEPGAGTSLAPPQPTLLRGGVPIPSLPPGSTPTLSQAVNAALAAQGVA